MKEGDVVVVNTTIDWMNGYFNGMSAELSHNSEDNLWHVVLLEGDNKGKSVYLYPKEWIRLTGKN